MELFEFFLTFYNAVIRLTGVIFCLMIIIFVHEMGHYLVGRWCGIGVSVFSVGFGPEIYSFKSKNGVRWRLASVPLGGYVKFVGDQSIAGVPAGQMLEEDLRLDSFSSASAWKRVATVFAGPFFNALFAVVVLAGLFFSFGQTISRPVIMDVLPGSPADQAGLRSGDKFLTMQGMSVRSFDDISRYVMSHEGNPVYFTIEREDEFFSLSVIPRVERVDDGFGSTIRIGRIGVTGSASPENIRRVDYNIVEALGQGIQTASVVIQQTVQFFGKLAQGRGDRCQLSGPVRSVQIAWKVSDFGFLALLQLSAFFSLSVGIFNLLPIPPLDGGHLFFYMIEGLSGCSVPLSVQKIVFRCGLLLVLSFMIFAILNNYIPC